MQVPPIFSAGTMFNSNMKQLKEHKYGLGAFYAPGESASN